MTCIVGVLDKENDCVYIGSDSLGSNGWTKAVYNPTKVFKSRNSKKVAIGVCGSYRCMDLLRYDEEIVPEIDVLKKTKIDHEYMVTKFVPRVIKIFKEGNVAEEEENRGSPFLVGTGNSLFEVQKDYSVLEAASGYDAVGSGYITALASLYSTKDETDIVARIVKALEASEDIVTSVQRPFVIINTKNDEVITIQ